MERLGRDGNGRGEKAEREEVDDDEKEDDIEDNNEPLRMTEVTKSFMKRDIMGVKECAIRQKRGGEGESGVKQREERGG